MGHAAKTRIHRAAIARAEGADRAEWHRRASLLYEELRAPATGLIRRAYGSTFGSSEIEDIYSSAWLGTLRALERTHARMGDDEIRNYLLTAVANHAGKEIRRRRRKPVAPIEAAGSIAETGGSPEDEVTSRETSQVTRDLLSSLPPRRRAVMLLRYGWGLEPAEICGMVKGLSARAYRKEITKGVDELADRIKLVEEGRWCEEREPVLKAFAAGVASEDQALQAKRHITHCRSCSDFVGRLSGHLHDVGSAVLLPGVLESTDGHSGVLERMRETAEGLRESLGGLARTETLETTNLAASGGRGAGAVGAGALAKIAGLGAGGKAALACLGGGIAATACVATGVGPFAIDDLTSGAPDRKVAKVRSLATLPIGESRDEPLSAQDGSDAPGSTTASGGTRPEPEPESAPAAERPVVERSTPPTSAEFGAESVAAPVSAPPPQTSSGSGGGAVAQEFAP